MDDIDHDAAIVERVHARAALAGNPSDGFGGAVFGMPVPAFTATATLRRISNGYELIDAHSGANRFEHWADLAQAAAADSSSPHCLMLGALASVDGRVGNVPPIRLEVATTIPMSVGLAGSSAIVIASIRALLRAADAAMDPVTLAVAALTVETEQLGIAAGLQDRIIQAHGTPMLMQLGPAASRSGPGEFTAKTPGERLRLLVAVRPGSSEPSQIVHGNLRARFEADSGELASAMSALAQHAVAAAAAFECGDIVALGAAMDSTFDIRSSLLDLSASHVEMITAARSTGASANYTGSGGAIVALCPTGEIESTTRQSLTSLGCTVVSVDPFDLAAGAD